MVRTVISTGDTGLWLFLSLIGILRLAAPWAFTVSNETVADVVAIAVGVAGIAGVAAAGARYLRSRRHREVEEPALEGRRLDLTFSKVVNQQRADHTRPLEPGSYYVDVAVRGRPSGLHGELPILEPRLHTKIHLDVRLEPLDDPFLSVEEPVRRLQLPPAGDSKAVRFKITLRDPRGADTVRFRVLVYYQFSLIESALVELEVAGGGGRRKRQSRARTRYQQQQRYRDLDHTRPRHLAIDIDGDHSVARLTFTLKSAAGREKVLVASLRLGPTDLNDKIIGLRNALTEISQTETFHTGSRVSPELFQDHVRPLARAGRALWRYLFDTQETRSLTHIGQMLAENPVEKGGRIEVMLRDGALEAVIPWSLLYDRKVPDDGQVDPDGFWGLRYQVEQKLETNSVSEFSDELPVPLRLDFMLYQLLDPNGRQQTLLQRLAQACGRDLILHSPPIEEAHLCAARLESGTADVLYFYAHAYTRPLREYTTATADLNRERERVDLLLRHADDAERAQVQLLKDCLVRPNTADHSWIQLTKERLVLDELYDRFPSSFSHTRNPLVFLNTCMSAQLSPALLESFPHFFLTRGARAVLGTECPVSTAFAHPLSERVLTALLSGDELGAALLDARRYFFKLYNPLGLAYTLYSPATVRVRQPILRARRQWPTLRRRSMQP